MEKLLNKTMAAPTAENKAKLLSYANKHPMAECMLSQTQMTVLNQYRREA